MILNVNVNVNLSGQGDEVDREEEEERGEFIGFFSRFDISLDLFLSLGSFHGKLGEPATTAALSASQLLHFIDVSSWPHLPVWLAGWLAA